MNKLIYVDHFHKGNSNYYWLEAFKEQFKFVETIEGLTSKARTELLMKVEKFKPDMIHFGGSIKNNSVLPVEVYAQIKEKHPGIRLTAHYGDAYYNEYNHSRLKYLDAFHTSNYANVTGPQAYWRPCCVLQRWIKTPIEIKKYDVVFIGNNYSGLRRKYLNEINKRYRLDVWGKGWEGFNNHGQCTIEESIDIYRSAKVVLSEFSGDYCRHSHMGGKCAKGQTSLYRRILCNNKDCPTFAPNICYFSNRVVNALASGSQVVTSYRTGMELIFNGRELYTYKDLDGCFKAIDLALKDPYYYGTQTRALDWTYEKAIQKLKEY